MISDFERRVLERMRKISGSNESVDDKIKRAMSHRRYTRAEADVRIKELENGPDIYVLDGDDGPVDVTREEMIKRVKRMVGK